VLYAGIVLLPTTVQLTSGDIKHRLQRSNAKCVIADSQTAEKVDQVLELCFTMYRVRSLVDIDLDLTLYSRLPRTVINRAVQWHYIDKLSNSTVLNHTLLQPVTKLYLFTNELNYGMISGASAQKCASARLAQCH